LTYKKARSSTKGIQKEVPITPTKIGIVLEQFCTMEKLTVNPTMIPFFTPCMVSDDNKLKAFIAPVNHNNLSENMVVDIVNTMMGDYCGSSNSHMQEFGDDAGVIVGWDDGDDVSYF
jgi:hypothetical protein